MYSLVRYYIKTSFVFLLLGICLGAYMVYLREVVAIYPDSQLITAHSHVILIGFVMMMILGVALWMFPRPRKEDTHYRPVLAEAIYWIMTIATSARFVGEIISAYRSWAILGWVITISSFLQVLAFLLFFYNIWTRIRPVGSHIREAKGEKF